MATSDYEELRKNMQKMRCGASSTDMSPYDNLNPDPKEVEDSGRRAELRQLMKEHVAEEPLATDADLADLVSRLAEKGLRAFQEWAMIKKREADDALYNIFLADLTPLKDELCKAVAESIMDEATEIYKDPSFDRLSRKRRRHGKNMYTWRHRETDLGFGSAFAGEDDDVVDDDDDDVEEDDFVYEDEEEEEEEEEPERGDVARRRPSSQPQQRNREGSNVHQETLFGSRDGIIRRNEMLSLMQ
jgi:hypothetical protein